MNPENAESFISGRALPTICFSLLLFFMLPALLQLSPGSAGAQDASAEPVASTSALAPIPRSPGFLTGSVKALDSTGSASDNDFSGNAEQASTYQQSPGINELSALYADFRSKSALQSAGIALVVDCSGSMDDSFKCDAMQGLLNRLCPVLVKMTGTDAVDCWLYASNFKQVAAITSSNLKAFVNESIEPECYQVINLSPATHHHLRLPSLGSLASHLADHLLGVDNKFISEGLGLGNNEGPLMKAMADHYRNAPYPTLIVFVTDTGVNHEDVHAELVETSRLPMFWQFVGISPPPSAPPAVSKGKSKLSPPQTSWDRFNEFCLKEFSDNLPDGCVRNSSFFVIDDYRQLTDQQIGQRLLSDFPAWARQSEQLGIIAPGAVARQNLARQ